MAQHLLSAGIATLVIPDASIFALMARVNKVLIGTQAVLATGGILGPSGSKLVAQAAKHYRVPFVVVTGAISNTHCTGFSGENLWPRPSCSVCRGCGELARPGC